MPKNRTDRLNPLLQEVISEVIHQQVRNPLVSRFVSVTRVDITKDLHHAKVYISVIGTSIEKEQTVAALQSAAGFIAVNASKKVVMRHFPELTFKVDSSVEQQMKIDSLLSQIHDEQRLRQNSSHESP